MKMQKVLVAGASGYLGKFVVQEFKKQGFWVRALARTAAKLNDVTETVDEIFIGEVTNQKSLQGICQDIDIVFSSIGITRQKDGFTYMDVDYQGNMNLLNEAVRNGVQKFIYVSVLNGQRLRHLKMVDAKERFVDELISSGIDYGIVRPNGFFSDMEEVLTMAQKGTVYLFGDGEYQGNPIHGIDLAEYIVGKLDSDEKEFDIGGPELLTQNQIAQTAFVALGKKQKVVHIPLWVKNITLKLIRFFSVQKTYGPIEFFMTVMTMDMIAPQFGNRHLTDYYKEVTRA
jgi:uncharacterized protein YbjT (DUF2867 family)